MLPFKELVAALKAVGITPESLFLEEYSAEQEEQLVTATGCRPTYVDWEEGADNYDRIFLFNGPQVDTSYHVRVRRYTGMGGGDFAEARFEEVVPVTRITYQAVPQNTNG